MQQSLHFESQTILSKAPFIFHFNGVVDPSFSKISSTSLQLKIGNSRLSCGPSDLPHLDSLHPTHSSRHSQKRTWVVSARKNNRRRNGWGITGKSALACALFIASNLKLLSDPIDLILNEGFGVGDGGGFGSGSGFGWRGFDGWGRRRKRKFGFLGFLLGSALFLMFVSRKEFEGYRDLGFGILGLVLLGALEKDWQRGFKSWVLGFCSCALMVIVGLKRDELQRWVRGLINVRSPVMGFLGRRRRRKLL